MDYIGNIVELKAHGGTYRGTVIDRALGKLTLEDVEFIAEDGMSTFLAQTRINSEDLDSTQVTIRKKSQKCAIDALAAYRQGEQQTLANKPTVQPIRNSHSTRNRQSNPATGWSSDISNVFPSNDVFDAEMDHHDVQFNQVASVSEMISVNDFIVLADLQLFSSAMHAINRETIVFLNIFGKSLGRTNRPSWIVISTSRGTFAFYVMNLERENYCHSGLAEFLSKPSNYQPRKIMCDSRFASDSLMHTLKIELDIYHDILALQSYLFMRANGGRVPRNAWNIIDLFHLYCPEAKDLDLIGHRFEFAQFEHDIWNTPAVFAKNSQIHLAISLTFHMNQLYEIMLTEFERPLIEAKEIFLNCYRNSPKPPFTTKKSVMRLPDSLAVFSCVDDPSETQYVNNLTFTMEKDMATEYMKGMQRCKMSAFTIPMKPSNNY